MLTIEIIAAISGILGIFMIIRQCIWGWPIGIVGVILYAYILFDAKLYSGVLLNIAYIFLNSYCWYSWLRQDKSAQQANAQVKKLSYKQIVTLAFSVVSLSGIVGHYMGSYSDADFPLWDAVILILSLMSQTLLANRYIAAWYGWIVVNILSIGLYWTKMLYPTMILYGIYLVLAILGILQWQKSYREQRTQLAASSTS